MSRLRVAVLMGGASAERAISLSTGRQIVAALDPAKYVAIPFDAACLQPADARIAAGLHPPALPPATAAAQAASDSGTEGDLVVAGFAALAEEGPQRPDVVIVALHGKGGEDGTIQGALEILGIPYTGSGVLASALAMDKARCSVFLRAEGIPVPADIVLKRGAAVDPGALHARVAGSIGYPLVVKPNAQGSTIGCSIVRGREELALAVEEAFKYDSTVLVEEFVAGVEITAGVLGNEEPEVLPLVEIVAKGGFYDYEAKYAPGGSEHVIPARISPLAAERARDYARQCHLALGCRGMSRVDMIVRDDEPYVLEVNTIPGMTPTSLLPDAARAAGIGFSELLDRIIGYALAD